MHPSQGNNDPSTTKDAAQCTHAKITRDLEMTIQDCDENTFSSETGDHEPQVHAVHKPSSWTDDNANVNEINQCDWETVSRVLDRAFFIFYGTCSIFVTCVFILTMCLQPDREMWSPIAEALNQMSEVGMWIIFRPDGCQSSPI